MFFYRRTCVTLLILWLTVSTVVAENGNELRFSEALRLKMPKFGRSGLRINPVEKQLVLGQWQAPNEGDQVLIGEETAIWEKITVDETGWFSDKDNRGAYIYCTVHADKNKVMLLEENGNDFVYVNGSPRIGNRYGFKAEYSDWEPRFDFVLVPVELKKGRNEFLFFNSRTGRLKANLIEPRSSVLINPNDVTMPDFKVGEAIDTWCGVVIVNATKRAIKDYKIVTRLAGKQGAVTTVPVIQPLTVRKVPVKLTGPPFEDRGQVTVSLELVDRGGDMIDKAELTTSVKSEGENYRRTFISKVDGSVQYYAVNPAISKDKDSPKALVLSVHGADVEASNQAGSYNHKSWANIVAPTNRRPYGFNWEDWGRTDALEVLDLAMAELNTSVDRIYLTGHSMGGHGTWHLGATFPDRFAAIGPSAGWISFWSYGVRGDNAGITPLQEILRRATSPSQTMKLAHNYKQLGVYVIHGDKDESVPVKQARMMVEKLKTFHKDFQYHEQPGQGHWWDISDEPGADCVDWAPLFDFFARHARPGKERIRRVEFVTANPGVSATNYWVTIEAQQKQLNFSKVDVRVDPGNARLAGETENVAVISFDLTVLPVAKDITVELDSQKLANIERPNLSNRLWLKREDGKWSVADRPSLSHKGPHRYGTFKDVFNNRFLLVYGTRGSQEERRWAFEKARYDAEFFWYQGNGNVDVIPDTEFDPEQEPDRNIILYGNAQTNKAWNLLLDHCPVQVKEGKIAVGQKIVRGDDLACLFVYPRPGSDVASVGAVSGTGIVGMQLTNRRPYLSPGYAYPDITIMTPDLLGDESGGYVAAGFFGLDWSVENGEIVWQHK